ARSIPTVLISMADYPFVQVDGDTLHSGTAMQLWAGASIPLLTLQIVFLNPLEYDCELSRSERLLNLWQDLRRHRLPVSGQILASEMGGSIRTFYRDIASLKAQGAAIEGEVGIGYIMSPGFMLPP
ncbi:HTH domain-containing protein, partial [Pseudomonas sp.]|uniref:helix-turn-helix transcriptional regulator n=1 Tax=Pseudomonas sp. TaxID=306 RepID=UPI002620768A